MHHVNYERVSTDKFSYFWLLLGWKHVAYRPTSSAATQNKHRTRNNKCGHLQPRRNWLICQCLDHPPYSPDLAPSDYNLFPGLKKIIERSPVFVRRGGHCCLGDLVGRKTFWIFFWVACISYSNGLRSLLSFVGRMLNKYRVWSQWLVSFLVGLKTYQHPLMYIYFFIHRTLLNNKIQMST